MFVNVVKAHKPNEADRLGTKRYAAGQGMNGFPCGDNMAVGV